MNNKESDGKLTVHLFPLTFLNRTITAYIVQEIISLKNVLMHILNCDLQRDKFT